MCLLFGVCRMCTVFFKKTNSKGAGRFQNIYIQIAAPGCFCFIYELSERAQSPTCRKTYSSFPSSPLKALLTKFE